MIGQTRTGKEFHTSNNEWVCFAAIAKHSNKNNAGYVIVLNINDRYERCGVSCTPDDHELLEVVYFILSACEDLNNTVDGAESDFIMADITHWVLSQIGESVEYLLWSGRIKANHQYVTMSFLELNNKTNTYKYSRNMLVCLCENGERIQYLNAKELYTCLHKNPEIPIYQTAAANEFELHVKYALGDHGGTGAAYEVDGICSPVTASMRMIKRLKGRSGKPLLFSKKGLYAYDRELHY